MALALYSFWSCRQETPKLHHTAKAPNFETTKISPETAPNPPGGQMALSLMSSSFRHYGPIPKKFTCDGENISPALTWKNIPQSAQSLTLIMDDPDAPVGTWVHWVIYNLPSNIQGFEEGLPKTETLNNGARQGLVWGVDQFSRVGYWGPCPPPGKPHRYYFKLFALSEPLDLPAQATTIDLEQVMKGRVLGQTELIGLYQRSL